MTTKAKLDGIGVARASHKRPKKPTKAQPGEWFKLSLDRKTGKPLIKQADD